MRGCIAASIAPGRTSARGTHPRAADASALAQLQVEPRGGAGGDGDRVLVLTEPLVPGNDAIASRRDRIHREGAAAIGDVVVGMIERENPSVRPRMDIAA